MYRLVFSLMLAAAVLTAQPAPEKFKVRVGTRLSGVEEFQTGKLPEGFRQSGKTHLEGSGTTVESTYETVLDRDRNLVRYRLEAQVGGAGGAQIIEAQREGEKIQLKIQAGGQDRSRTLDWQPGTVALDNIVGAHFQLLLDGIAEGGGPVRILIPQSMAVVLGKVTPAGEEAGTLDGQPVKTRKYLLEIGSLTTEVWAQTPGTRLMRVYVPLQDVEMVREGFALPPPAKEQAPKNLTERTLTFPSGGLQFPATLCLPLRLERVALVVLVHGSGPHDRDETIGPNKPFRDLAHGLAAAGIATLRYEKRTKAFLNTLDRLKVTVEEEVIADAAAAVRYARTLREVDPQRVFVLGHSLGGSMAPFIGERVPEVRGLILMAAAGRPLDELIYEQIPFQMRVAGQKQEDIDKQVENLRQFFARVRSGEAQDSEPGMGVPAFYWRDLLSRDTPAALKRLGRPVLILQGGKDVQVKKADYDALQAAVPKAEAHWFPNLNHLFMGVEGEATGSEYTKPSKVDPKVIQTIADWVGKN